MTDLQALREELAEMRKEQGALLTEFRSFISGQEERCKNAVTQRDGHHRTLYGEDGTQGLTARVQTIEERMNLVWLGVLGLVAWAWQFISSFFAAPPQGPQ